MAVSGQVGLWDLVLELTKMAQQKGADPLLWAIQVSSSLNSGGVVLPSPDLARLLVSYICWDNNVPIAWKLLDKALVLKIAPPMLLIACLSTRVIPSRHSQPAAYRLYMELLKRHAFTLKSQMNAPTSQNILKSIDAELNFSSIYGLQANEPGVVVVEWVFSIVCQLLDASLDDEGLLELTPEKKSTWATKPQDMELDIYDSYTEGKTEFQEMMQKANTVMAIEMIARFLQNKVTSKLLCLARQNMPTHWMVFTQRLRLLGENSSALTNSNILTPEAFVGLASESHLTLSQQCKRSSLQKFHAVLAVSSHDFSSGLCHGATQSALWLPLDLALENAMDGSLVIATSAIEIITGLIKALQAINGTTWHDTFLGLWVASLRLVQRERDPIEGPVPRLDTRLCMLLSITILVVAELIEEEESVTNDETDSGFSSPWHEKVPGKRRVDLVSSLQVLGDYQGLLTPPRSVISAANQAAAKAMMIISRVNVGNAYFECIGMKDMPIQCSGNLRHLIVEACIARNLLDTSAYFWPGYVNGRINQIPQSMPAQVPSWSSFMKGAPLTPPMINALASTPASSLAELEKIFEVAVRGSNNDKMSAATILCGASLIRGWNIQEHTVHFITRLLSPPVPADYSSGSESHLIGYAPMLNILIVGIASVDCVQIISLHGLIPQLACALMPICEVFGSCVPTTSWTLTTGEEISAHAVFSNAFTLLLKLWRFNHPPLEHSVGDVPPVGSQLTPEYLLLIRNSHLMSSGNAALYNSTVSR